MKILSTLNTHSQRDHDWKERTRYFDGFVQFISVMNSVIIIITHALIDAVELRFNS